MNNFAKFNILLVQRESKKWFFYTNFRSKSCRNRSWQILSARWFQPGSWSKYIQRHSCNEAYNAGGIRSKVFGLQSCCDLEFPFLGFFPRSVVFLGRASACLSYLGHYVFTAALWKNVQDGTSIFSKIERELQIMHPNISFT